MPRDDWPILAILHSKHQKFSPSNDQAINKFVESALSHELNPIIVTENDFHMFRILAGNDELCGLLIRDTTSPSNHTYEFSLTARLHNVKVIDNPDNIMRGCNKVWQVNQFRNHHINHPHTWIMNKGTFRDIANHIQYPAVIKTPDSCFSEGVFLAKDKTEFLFYTVKIFAKEQINCLLVQEFVQTEFDWRIGVLQQKLLFSCKYYMAEEGWKIVKYDPSQGMIEGRHKAIDGVSPELWEFVQACFPFLDDGLYGFDVKEKDGKFYMIEINDNPSIDAGVEDGIPGRDHIIYDRIIEYFMN